MSRRLALHWNGKPIEVDVGFAGTTVTLTRESAETTADYRREGPSISLTLAGAARRAVVAKDARGLWVSCRGRTWLLVPEGREGTARGAADAPDEIRAPMTGRVVSVTATAGASAKEGDLLLTIEAMKMEFKLTAPKDGTVLEVACGEGDRVELGQLLVRLKPAADPGEGVNIRIVEVGPRDGLQNEKQPISTDVKVALVDALSEAGFEEIEVSAFVSPKWIPQLADAAEVFARIRRRSGVLYSALVPNETGLDRALEAGVGKVAVFTAASETFNRKNINATIEESIARFAPVVPRALEVGVRVRGYISTAFSCPYEGKIEPGAVVAVAKRLLDLGVEELSIGDTIGKATTEEVHALLDRLLDAVPQDQIALHFHDTYGMAVTNALAAYARGITIFDASVGGVGGCPYAPGAAGNVATEDLVTAFERAGAPVGLDLAKISAASELLASALGRRLRPPAAPSS